MPRSISSVSLAPASVKPRWWCGPPTPALLRGGMPEAEGDSSIVGSVLDGRYRVDRVIGAGGFGTVYAGFHLTLGQPVAIKLFRIADDTPSGRRAELLAGFVEEARLLTRLRHDNIVRMLDQGFTTGAGAPAGSPYAVMEYCPHGSLRDLIAERGAPLPLAEALDLVKGIVAGMRHAHENGIAHRDLKPGNVMLDKRADGSLVARIIDFGIAKLIEEEDTAGSGATRTRSATVSLTPAYAAPEQAIGGRTGMWTDVHAIGLIFCELLTGVPPYGNDDLSLKIIDPVRPTPAAAGVDAGPFEPVIRRALAIRPDERYPDARALEQAIAEAEHVSPAESVPAPSPRRRALLFGAGALATAVVAGFAFRRARGPEPAPAPASVASATSATAASTVSAAAASASATRPSVPSLATLTAAQVVARMLAAGLAPLTTPAPDASMLQLMVPFKQASSTGAVYANTLPFPADLPAAAHAMLALMNVRSWVATDRRQGFGLAYIIDDHRVFSMSWTPKPSETALERFETLSKELPFDIRGCSWMGADPSADAKLTKPLWYAKRLADLSTVELALRLEASGATPPLDVRVGQFQAALMRRGVHGEIAFFPATGTNENEKAVELAALLRKQKMPFLMASDGGAALIAKGKLADAAFVNEVLAGVASPPALVLN